MTPRFLGSVTGALIFLGLPAIFLSSGTAPRPAWWEARLIISVKGEYSIKGGGPPVAGKFTCRARWEGRLNPDGDDFLIYHLKTEILEWHLTEKAAGPGGESVLGEQDTAAQPILRLNYFLRDGTDVEISFSLMGIPVPLHSSPLKVGLELPRSPGRGIDSPGHAYADFVCRGSNRLALPADDLGRRSPERAFSWEWRREKKLANGSRAFLVTERHAAEAVVSLVAH